MYNLLHTQYVEGPWRGLAGPGQMAPLLHPDTQRLLSKVTSSLSLGDVKVNFGTGSLHG